MDSCSFLPKQGAKYFCCRGSGAEAKCGFETQPEELKDWLQYADEGTSALLCKEVAAARAGRVSATFQPLAPPTPDTATAAAAAQVQPAISPPTGGSSNGLGPGAALGFAVLAVVIALSCTLSCMFLRRNRRRRAGDKRLVADYVAQYGDGGFSPHSLSDASSGTEFCLPLAPRAGGGGPGGHRATQDKMLKKQLKALAKERFCMAGRFTLHTPKAIVRDEAGVVVPAAPTGSLARGGKSTSEVTECMAMFHANSSAFECERSVLGSAKWSKHAIALVAALPAAGGEPLYARGAALPPCVVSEAGESVREWAAGHGSDTSVLAQTLVQVCLLPRFHHQRLIHSLKHCACFAVLGEPMSGVSLCMGPSAFAVARDGSA